MNFVLDIFKGIALGAGCILPGISSGVLCVIFGIYEKLLDSILHFFSDSKNNFKFLFPIIIGIAFGVILFGNALNYFFFQFPIQTKCIFIGLILGSIPALIKEIHTKEAFKPSHLPFLLIALLIGISCIFLEKSFAIQTLENVSFFYLMACGFFMSIRNCCAWC